MTLRYLPAVPLAPTAADELVAGALRAAGVWFQRQGLATWNAQLPWRTLVFGLVAREVDEDIVLELIPGDAPEVRVSCTPRRTHGAHAAGLAGVLMLAVAVWLVGGWWAGAPAGATFLIGGGLWVAYTREMALMALDRRLRTLLADVGTVLWPRLPARILPPPTAGVPRLEG